MTEDVGQPDYQSIGRRRGEEGFSDLRKKSSHQVKDGDIGQPVQQSSGRKSIRSST